MAVTCYRLLVCLGAALLIGIAFKLRIVAQLECLLLILAFEVNCAAVGARQSTAKRFSRSTTSYVACCIGYQETIESFTRCVKSYMQFAESCKAFIVALDGSPDENYAMVEVLNGEVSSDRRVFVLLDKQLGPVCESSFRQARIQEHKEYHQATSAAFRAVYQYAKSQIEPQLESKRSSQHVFPVIIISQPHGGMKEVRFTAWISSLVIADLFNADLMWSSDSDSYITSGCIEAVIAAIVGDDEVGGACAALAVHDRQNNLLNRIYGGFYQCGVYLLRSSASSVGRSTCITGPSACYRTKALRGLVIEWYMQSVWNKKTWVNEDAHMTTLLAREGWLNLYVLNGMVVSEAPLSWKAWLKQMIRWERAQHLERLLSPQLVFDPSQGIVSLLVHIRELLLHFYLFLYIAVFATTEISIPTSYPRLGIGLIVSQLVQNIWNAMRSPEQVGDWLGCLLASLLYLFAYPFTHVWSLCTLFADSWESRTKRRSGIFSDRLLFLVWICLGCCYIVRFVLRAIVVIED